MGFLTIAKDELVRPVIALTKEKAGEYTSEQASLVERVS